VQRQNLQFAEQQTALKLSWNSLDLVYRASRQIVLLPSRLWPAQQLGGAGRRAGIRNTGPRYNRYKARELYYGYRLMSIVISTFGGGIFSRSEARGFGATRGGNDDSLCPSNRTECL
jgi:hypothetical protein